MKRFLSVAMLLLLCGFLCICVTLFPTKLFRLWGGETIVFHLNSPDELYSVRLIELNGGATTGFIRQISLMPNSHIAHLFNDSTPVVSVEGKRDFKVIWLGQKTLKIGIEPGARFHFRRHKWRDVEIIYCPIWEIK